MKISGDVIFEKDEFTELIAEFAQQIKADSHHRLRSWHHAHAAWQEYLDKRIDDDHATLHLAFYLASWGMYRGSSKLLQRDFLALKPAVQFLADQRQDWESLLFSTETPEKIAKDIRELANGLKSALVGPLTLPGTNQKQANVTDTLLSKILLGTLGAVPAFDTEVKKALRKEVKGYKSGDSFVQKKLAAVIELARAKQDRIENGQAILKRETELEFTRTLVLDLYLWGKGRKLNEAKKSKAG